MMTKILADGAAAVVDAEILLGDLMEEVPLAEGTTARGAVTVEIQIDRGNILTGPTRDRVEEEEDPVAVVQILTTVLADPQEVVDLRGAVDPQEVVDLRGAVDLQGEVDPLTMTEMTIMTGTTLMVMLPAIRPAEPLLQILQLWPFRPW